MWWDKIGKWFGNVVGVASGGVIGDEEWEDIESMLLQADFGVELTEKLIDTIKVAVRGGKELKTALKEVMLSEFMPDDRRKLPVSSDGKLKILFIGVNGTGKTTTVAKMAYRFKKAGKKVLMVAGDTFRAAAIEQLVEWGRRIDVPVIRQTTGSDAGAVVYDGVASFKARGYDVLLVDTAGRMHTKHNLMQEMGKVNRILKEQLPDVPQENLLVVDSSIGQNSYNQAKLFKDKVGLDGVVLTKMDGTFKGGIVLRIEKELQIPVKFVGTGEGVSDIEEFSPKVFVNRILNGEGA